MTKDILQALPELVQAEVITPATADQIRDYYRLREGKPTHLLFVVFGFLGALLVGLGVILMLAHNWDELSRSMRTALAFLPLILGQGLAFFVMRQRHDRPAWRESAAAFLFLAVGACMALVSQIYHIPGNGSTFLLTWMVLGLPLVYLLRSSATSLLFIAGITYYAVQSQHLSDVVPEAWYYWLLLAAVMPHYRWLYRQKPTSNFTIFHHWFLPVSAAIALVTVDDRAEHLLLFAFGSLFGIYTLAGASPGFGGQKLRNNGYLVVGVLGTLGLLLVLSFDFFWNDLVQQQFSASVLFRVPEGVAVVLISLLALLLLVRQLRHQHLKTVAPVSWCFLVLLLVWPLAWVQVALAVVAINVLVLALGLLYIREGARRGHLGIMNLGLLLLAALITCRFFDTDLSFVIRGLLFVLLGLGFFGANLWLLQKRKKHDQ